jgi:RND family efflux transporter MFP subunit
MNLRSFARVQRWLFWAALTVGVLFAGFKVAKRFIDAKPKAGRTASWTRPALVETTALVPVSRRALVEAYGTVVAAQQLTVTAEVAGKVLEVHPNLVAGGVVRQGEPLVELDARDYALQVSARSAEIANAKLTIQTEKSRKAVAEREWALLGELSGTDVEGKALSLREPQLVQAQAALQAAKASLDLARLQLERTKVSSPLDAVVLEETVEVGQIALPQAKLATLVGTKEFWVHVSVPVEQLSWLSVPGINDGPPSTAKVSLAGSHGAMVERSGKIVRLLSQVEQQGRMARLVVSVDDPLGLAMPEGSRPLPMLLGAYVRVELEGRQLEDVYAIAPASLRDEKFVWLTQAPQLQLIEAAGDAAGLFTPVRFSLTPGPQFTWNLPSVAKQAIGPGLREEVAKLAVVPVRVVRAQEDEVLIAKEGVPPDARLVTSRLAAPVPGASLRLEKAAAAPTANKGPAPKAGEGAP